MKILKTSVLLAIFLLLSPQISISQDNQMYWVHEDQVKPSKIKEYESVTKDFIAACKDHDLKDAKTGSRRASTAGLI